MNSTDNHTLDFVRDVPFDQILTNPILDIAARFWEKDRYEAFKVCYRSMRRLDDLVDHRKETGELISASEARQFQAMMTDWLQMVRREETADPFVAEMVVAIGKYSIPIWPWERLLTAMAYDLSHNGYSSFLVFLRYTEGAAISPASIFMHLIGYQPELKAPPYDIRLAARDLAIFSYLTHIIRDFQKDRLVHLNYFADDILKAHSVAAADLDQSAKSGEPTASFRALVSEYKRLADRYRLRARSRIDQLRPLLAPRYQLSLELIYQLYLQIFERIDPDKGSFTTEELNPTPPEVKARIDLTLENFTPAKN